MAHTALVLGGGGVTGIAWELGILKGLADAGQNLSSADTVIGTSAGSVVGAQLTSGRSVHELYEGQLGPADAEIGAKFGLTTILRMTMPALLPGSAAEKRSRIGRAALKAHPESAEARVEVIGSRMESRHWPQRDLRITAVDTATGELRVFGPDCGVDLVHAIAASCAVPLVWPAVQIGDRRYMDGGIRSTANVDLATGADAVVVLAPLPQSFSKHHAIPAQLARLGDQVRSVVATPDKEALAAIGRNVLDPTKRADAARTGLRQAAEVADRVAVVWAR
ncbi:MAG TPA: patatin-like phospholipase family protein [Nocardioidaceae bacterium]|nr:patatin-like phospholipase family protein [Nocardioidaceae bacterium]